MKKLLRNKLRELLGINKLENDFNNYKELCELRNEGNWRMFESLEKNINTKYFELKHYIKNKETYFRRVHYWERNMGKTYSLIKLAQKYKCPIAVNSESSAMYIKRLCRDLKIKNINILPCNNSIRGKKFEVILCEEDIDSDFAHQVLKPMCKCLVGYNNIDTYSNKRKFQQEYECKWIG